MLKKIFICIITIMTILTAFKIIECNAIRRSLNLNEVMKPNEVLSWRIEINEKYFNVLVDRADKTVTVKGYVDDFYEMYLVKRHFDLRSPSNYKIIYKIDIVDASRNEMDFAD